MTTWRVCSLLDELAMDLLAKRMTVKEAEELALSKELPTSVSQDVRELVYVMKAMLNKELSSEECFKKMIRHMAQVSTFRKHGLTHTLAFLHRFCQLALATEGHFHLPEWTSALTELQTTAILKAME